MRREAAGGISISEKAYEKHAWLLLFAVGIVIFILGLFVAIGGGSADPDFPAIAGMTYDELRSSNPGVADYIDFFRLNLGLFLLGFAVFTMAVAWKSFRKGEKWAWYVLWSLPLIFGLGAATNLSAGGVGWPLLTALGITSLAGLLLPIRKFFPKS